MNQSTINLNYPVDIRNQSRLHQLIDNIFMDFSKVLTVRLDFYIQKEYEEFNNYFYMNECFTRLRNNLRFKSLFEHYITYIASLEHGQDRKWHYHVLFFFDGQQLKSDYQLAKEIGEYWVNVITRGIGAYNSPNMNKSRYRTFALGNIGYNDAEAIANLKAVSDYLVKAEKGLQHLPDSELGKSYRTYRQGQYKPKLSNLGRPRASS